MFVPLLSDLSLGGTHFANGESGISAPSYRKAVSCIFMTYWFPLPDFLI